MGLSFQMVLMMLFRSFENFGLVFVGLGRYGVVGPMGRSQSLKRGNSFDYHVFLKRRHFGFEDLGIGPGHF